MIYIHNRASSKYHKLKCSLTQLMQRTASSALYSIRELHSSYHMDITGFDMDKGVLIQCH